MGLPRRAAQGSAGCQPAGFGCQPKRTSNVRSQREARKRSHAQPSSEACLGKAAQTNRLAACATPAEPALRRKCCGFRNWGKVPPCRPTLSRRAPRLSNRSQKGRVWESDAQKGAGYVQNRWCGESIAIAAAPTPMARSSRGAPGLSSVSSRLLRGNQSVRARNRVGVVSLRHKSAPHIRR